MRGVDIVLHLAADVGGLGYSSTHPATQFYNCTMLDFQVAEAARLEGVKKVIALSSSTAYPAEAPSPLAEEDLFMGPPRSSHAGYGWAKRQVVSLAQLYHAQYGLDMAVLIATNCYGPGDNFDPSSSHVIPSTIRKCLEEQELVVWGDGSPIRDFVYVEDLADAVLLAAERLPGPEYVNIGSGQEITIRKLVELVARLTNFGGPIRFDTGKPKGEPIRTVSVEKARRIMGFEAKVPLEEGLARTIDWYRASTAHNRGSR
jgi:GDP-L-fucose synthase